MILRKIMILSILFLGVIAHGKPLPSGQKVLQKVDSNQWLDHAIIKAKMVIHNRSGTRTITSQSWTSGKDKAFFEYLSPPREKGKKMLKLADKLWTYTPEPHDRVIAISGHLLKQSVLGSDLSYEDYMNNDSMVENYDAKVTSTEVIEGRICFVLELTAKRSDVPYAKQKIWVDSKRWVVLKAHMLAKNGKLLKKSTTKEVVKIANRWYPKKIHFKDMLSKGNGTEYHIETMDLNTKIPQHKFTKAALRR